MIQLEYEIFQSSRIKKYKLKKWKSKKRKKVNYKKDDTRKKNFKSPFSPKILQFKFLYLLDESVLNLRFSKSYSKVFIYEQVLYNDITFFKNFFEFLILISQGINKQENLCSTIVSHSEEPHKRAKLCCKAQPRNPAAKPGFEARPGCEAQPGCEARPRSSTAKPDRKAWPRRQRYISSSLV